MDQVYLLFLCCTQFPQLALTEEKFLVIIFCKYSKDTPLQAHFRALVTKLLLKRELRRSFLTLRRVNLLTKTASQRIALFIYLAAKQIFLPEKFGFFLNEETKYFKAIFLPKKHFHCEIIIIFK